MSAEPTTAEPEAMPSTAVAVVDPPKTTPAVTDWDDKYRRLVKRTVLKPKNREATEVELALFAEQVKRTGLDPFHRQIYGIYRKNQGVEEMTTQVGIDGFRLIAERTGKYDGQTEQEWCGPDGVWHTVWTQDGHPFAARCGVYKRGRRQPTYAVAHWAEYVQTFNGNPTGKWKSTDKGGMPANQLSKCAEALALRKCFPAELSGLYTPEEMEQADNSHADLTSDDDDEQIVAPLPRVVEDIIARAASLGHGLSNRGAAAMAVTDQPEAAVAEWCREKTAILDLVEAGRPEPEPEDAVVVEPEARTADLSPQPSQTANPPSEPVPASEAPAAPPESGEFAEPTPDEQAAADKLGVAIVSQGFLDDGPPRKATPAPAVDEDRIAALRRRGEDLLASADGLDSDDPRRDEIEQEFGQIADEVERLEGPGDGQATLL